ncbi:MAG: hypothetical protein O2810_05870 [Bacteroidetes bacterium]|nr:hypothetical protein [Bacteroidota bacterium]MDA0888591.1 hypothetical protein [Bacteroidota bacterium]MDA1085039.1 hypothetical protein [Bacteroidota bacterium]
MRKLILLFICITALVSAQQTELSEADAILNDLFVADSLDVLDLFDDLKKQDYLYLTVLYNNKTLFSGRDFGVEQYSAFPSISYINGNNFFANLSSGYYSGITPNWDFVTISGGYSNYIDTKKTLLATGVYSYSSYTQDVADLNNHRISIGLSYRKKWFRNSLTAGYLFGGASSSFVSNNTYVSIDLLDTKTLDISIQPRLGLFWGSQTDRQEFVRYRPYRIEVIDNDYFQLLNTELSIPVEFDFGNWDIEIDYTFSAPNPLPSEENLENTGFISFSVGYLIGL